MARDGIIVRAAYHGEIGGSPAAMIVGGRLPVLVLNGVTFPRLSLFARRFVVCHELGHLLLSTGAETVADAFALGILAGSERGSLKGCVDALAQLDITPRRMASLCRLALWADWRSGR